MELREAVQTRRSIRRFRPEPVPADLVWEMLAQAAWAPSWGNTQSWKCYLVTGNALEAVRQGNREALEAGRLPAPDMTMPQTWPELLKKRYTDTGKRVLQALGIPREDKTARLGHSLDMFQLFGAPCLLVFTVDQALVVPYAMLDVGSLVQTFCLLAHDRGLGTCIMAVSVGFPEVLRRCLPVAKHEAFAIGVAVGYPDAEAPVNRFPRARAPLSEWVVPVAQLRGG